MEGDETISITEKAMILGIEEIVENLEKIREIQVSTDKTVYWIFVILLLPYIFGFFWFFFVVGTPT
jgi:hypothetical protein